MDIKKTIAKNKFVDFSFLVLSVLALVFALAVLLSLIIDLEIRGLPRISFQFLNSQLLPLKCQSFQARLLQLELTPARFLGAKRMAS